MDAVGLLPLHNQLQVTLIKHFSDLQARSDYELEKGTVELSGKFHYQIRSFADRTLRQHSLDIAELKIREKYWVKPPINDGEAEDSTEKAIKLALSRMVEEIIGEIEDDLEADELRDLLRD